MKTRQSGRCRLLCDWSKLSLTHTVQMLTCVQGHLCRTVKSSSWNVDGCVCFPRGGKKSAHKQGKPADKNHRIELCLDLKKLPGVYSYVN